MKTFSSIVRNDLVHNALALYGVQACRKLLPLVSIPYLARVLKPEGWGTVAFVTSLGELVVLFIEFGFSLSATRDIAQNRGSNEQCGRIISSVIGAQTIMAMLTAGIVLILAGYIPVLRDHPPLLWAGLMYGVFQGMNPIWFFQGFESIRLAAAIEIAGKVLALCALFVLVKSPSDDWKVLALQAVPAVLSTVFGLWLASRRVRLSWPTLAQIKRSIQTSWPMFVFRSGESLYGAGNAFVLGLFAPPASVGYFAIADKISRAIFGLMSPIREALYPRLSDLAARSYAKAARLARVGAAIMIGSAIPLGLGIYFFAPFLIRTVASASFAPAARVLQIFAILPFLRSITYSVGLQWLFPFGQDSAMNRILLSAGALNLSLAFILAPHFAYYGMAWAVTCTETFVCVCMVVVMMRTTPFWGRRSPQGTVPTVAAEIGSRIDAV
jgi:PST family polysaccharide transporter